MNDRDIRSCLEITRKMIARPCFEVYQRPVILENQKSEKIKIPSGLLVVEHKLVSRMFRSRPEWENEMNSICDTATSGLEPECLESQIAHHFKFYFNKQLRKSIPSTPLPWMHKVVHLYQKIDGFIFNAPNPVFQEIDISDVKKPTPKNGFKELGKRLNGMKNRYDVLNLLSIINMNGTEIDTELEKAVIHFEDLPPPTVFALVHYLKERCRGPQGVQKPAAPV